MDHKMLPNFQEDYKVRAILSDGDKQICVPCKIFLPKTIFEKPKLFLLPDNTQFDSLCGSFRKCKFTASIGDPPVTNIYSDDVFISGGSIRQWGEGLDEGLMEIYPSTLIVRHYLNNTIHNVMRFLITPSLHLAPFDRRILNSNGTASITDGKRLQFELYTNFIVTFMNSYKWQRTEDNKTITFSELVAEAKFEEGFNEKDIDKYIGIMDDFLLLVSLAEGQRCMIPKVNIILPEQFIEIYRLDRSLPKISSNHSFNEFLIISKDLIYFLNSSWELYKISKHYDLLKSALEINTDDSHKTVESRFLALFSSIETLILAYRREYDLEYIIYDPRKWNTLKRKIKESIKNFDIQGIDKKRKSIITRNINALNRIPLQLAFTKFLKDKKVEVNDLWPFSADKSDCSLTNIRNLLVHGHGLQEIFIDAFHVALENLEYYAKRLLLVSLGWDYNESKLFRRDEAFIGSWQMARDIMRKW